MIAALGVGLACALLYAVCAIGLIDGLWRPDAFDYAQIAREVARGEGFGSRQAIYALHLEFLKEQGGLETVWPNLHRFPLPSLVMAAGFRLFGAQEAVVVGSGIAFHAATVALVFAWGRAAASPAVGLAAAALLTFNGVMFETATAGLSEPPALFFFTAALYALWRQTEGAREIGAVGAGLALGLAALARSNVLFVAPVLALALGAAPAGTRGRRLAAFGLGIAVAVAPWAVRNGLVAGSPFFSLHSYFLLPSGVDPQALKWDLDVPWVTGFVTPLAYALENPTGVLAKWASNAAGLLGLVPTLGGSLGIFGLAALACLRPAGPDRLVGLARIGAGAFVLNAALVSLGDFVFDKYHFHFVPLASLLAAGVVAGVIERRFQDRFQAGLLAVAVLVLANPPGWIEAWRVVPARIDQVDRDHLRRVADAVPANGVVVSDQSYAVAWEADRRAIRTHFTRLPDGTRVLGVLELAERYVDVDAVYLSAVFLRDPGARAIVEATLARVPDFRRAFPHVQRFENGALLFLRDAPGRRATPQRT